MLKYIHEKNLGGRRDKWVKIGGKVFPSHFNKLFVLALLYFHLKTTDADASYIRDRVLRKLTRERHPMASPWTPRIHVVPKSPMTGQCSRQARNSPWVKVRELWWHEKDTGRGDGTEFGSSACEPRGRTVWGRATAAGGLADCGALAEASSTSCRQGLCLQCAYPDLKTCDVIQSLLYKVQIPLQYSRCS